MPIFDESVLDWKDPTWKFKLHEPDQYASDSPAGLIK
jgi:hypothetical protein